MSTLLRAANPFSKTAGYALPHAIVIALAVSAAFALGLFAGSPARFSPAYYQHTYQAPLKIPTTRQKIAPPSHTIPLPSSGSIHFVYFTAKDNQQSDLGSCQSWAFVKQASYALNWNTQPNGTHFHRFYSPRFTYDVVSNGQDAGSYLEQYPPVVDMLGIPQWTQFPYGNAAAALGYPAYAVDYPVTAAIKSAAAAHHVTVSEQPLFQYPGAGQGGVDLIRASVASHHAVNIDFPVYTGQGGYDQANADGSTVIPPQPGDVSRGGHANTIVRYDDSHNNGDGTYGAVLVSNQWGWQAGDDKYGVHQTDGSPNGYIWLSYSFVRQYAFGVGVIHVSSASTGARHLTGPPVYVPSLVPTHKAPPLPRGVKALKPQPGAAALQVTGIRTRDTGVDISASINAAAARYGFSAPGYAALMGTESNINQYAPHYPINGAGYCDYSGGLTQITVCTAAGLGIGNGSLSQANINYVFWYEQADANRDVAFSARLVDQFHHAVCWDWYELYSSWNLGPGYGCYASIYQYPSNSITQQAVANFKGWLSWVYAGHVRYGPSPPPPPPTPKHYTFPAGHWNHYRNRHHLPHIAHQHHGKLTWAASVWWSGQGQRLCRYSGIKRPERWLSRLKVMRTDFVKCVLYTWPSHPGSRPKIVRR